MNVPRYEEHEGDFIEAMATRYGFTGKSRFIFEKRFLEDNAGLSHAKLAEIYKTKLIERTKKRNAAQILRQQVKAICDKLEAAGCPPSEGIRYEQAEPLYEQALEMTKRLFNGDHPDVATHLNNLAGLLAVTHHPAEALELMRQAAEVEDRIISRVFAAGSDRDRLHHLQTIRYTFEHLLI